MTTKEVQDNYCNRCPHKADCGYLSRNLQNDCVELDNYMSGYEAGREEVIEKAVEWLYTALYGEDNLSYSLPEQLRLVAAWFKLKEE